VARNQLAAKHEVLSISLRKTPSIAANSVGDRLLKPSQPYGGKIGSEYHHRHYQDDESERPALATV